MVLTRTQYSPSEHLSSGVNKETLRILSSFYHVSQGSLEPAFLCLIYYSCPLFQPHLYALPICILHSSQTEHVLVPLISLALWTKYIVFLPSGSVSSLPLFAWTIPIHFQVSTLPSVSLGKALQSTLTELSALPPVCSYNLTFSVTDLITLCCNCLF